MTERPSDRRAITPRRLGGSGISISPLVLGGNVFGWTADKQASFAVLDRFADAGFEAIDTADVYSSWASGNSGGESETVIGEWMTRRGRRDATVVITKVGADSRPTPWTSTSRTGPTRWFRTKRRLVPISG